MKLRVAMHTTSLEGITGFYTRLLGLKILGNFKGHNGYDGVFIGLSNTDWHLEFTVSAEPPVHQADEEDLLVFYPDTAEHYHQLISLFKKEGIQEVAAKNPYWKVNGHTYTDPDGYRVVIAITKQQNRQIGEAI